MVGFVGVKVQGAYTWTMGLLDTGRQPEGVCVGGGRGQGWCQGKGKEVRDEENLVVKNDMEICDNHANTIS